VKTVYELWTLKQVFSIISVSTVSSTWTTVLILLDGFVWFCLCAAWVVVFVRVQQQQ
jgi:hypothetical protein